MFGLTNYILSVLVLLNIETETYTCGCLSGVAVCDLKPTCRCLSSVAVCDHLWGSW